MCLGRDLNLKKTGEDFETTNKILLYWIDYISGERKQDNFNTQYNFIKTAVDWVSVFYITSCTEGLSKEIRRGMCFWFFVKRMLETFLILSRTDEIFL